eukprot:509569_1
MSNEDFAVPDLTKAVVDRVARSKEEKLRKRQVEADEQKYKKQKLRAEKEQEEEEKTHRFTQTNYSSRDSGVTEGGGLHTFYCSHCGAFCMITDTTLNVLPQRSTDKAFALEEEKYLFRPELVKQNDPVCIRRGSKIEKQFRMHCKGCDLVIGYRSVPHKQPTQFLYLLSDALSDDPIEAKHKIDALRRKLEAARKKDGDEEHVEVAYLQ